jgi:hypothetical protein
MIQDFGGQALAGHAFATRAIGQASPWGGTKNELRNVVNADRIPLLPVFDTWTLNWDRCPPKGDIHQGLNYDNVLLAQGEHRGGPARIIAIDHGECFAMGQELNERISGLGRIRDERVFGMFSAFQSFVTQERVEQAASRLGQVNRSMVQNLVDGVPADWEVSAPARNSVVELVCQRADFLTMNIMDMLKRQMGRLFL